MAALKSLTVDGPLPQADLPYLEVLREAAAHLGPFALLPDGLRQQLIRSYQGDERLRTLSHGRLSRGLLSAGAAYGRVLYRLESSTGRLRSSVPQSWRPAVDAARRALRRRARAATHVPFRTRRWLSRTAARIAMRWGAPRLPALLCAADFEMTRLGYEYLEGLQQTAGCVSVQRAAGTTYAQLIGVDFVASDGLLWFLEGNGNPALMDARLQLYPAGQDPWVQRMLAAATKRGFRRVVVYGYRPFSPGHAAALVAAGRECSVDVTIVDDVFAARHPGHRRAWLMDPERVAGALVVRAKTFDVLFDRGLLSKRQTRHIVEPRAEVLRAAGVELPRWLAPGETVPQYQPELPYPSVVAKIDGLDRGAGIAFYKVPRIPADLGADYCEAYHIPGPCPFRVVSGRREALPSIGPRAWKVRSYALLTPEGVEYLSSIKVISGRPVPTHLGDGLVAEKNIYLATINEGGVYSAVTDEEDQQYQQATAAVGGVLLEWLARKYGGGVGA